jgi:rhamnosyltransferase
MSPEVLVSIVIPVKNGDIWLKQVIPAILDQDLEGGLEVIVIDSGSTDDTLNILSNYPVKLIRIEPGSFNHGSTRNMGAEMARGRYVVMTVQDAKPVSRRWLKTMMEGFTNENVAGVCGQQIVPHHHDKNPVEWYRPMSLPEQRKISFSSPEVFSRLSPDEQLALCRWDNVNAMYRKDILLKVPFRHTDFTEDAIWARDILMSGYSIVYHPLAQVEHYHMENYDYAFKRNFSIQFHFYKYFGHIPKRHKQKLSDILKTVKLLLMEEGFSIREKINWFRYTIRNQRAVLTSNALFLDSIQSGGVEKLDQVYSEVCKSVPQALKSLNND